MLWINEGFVLDDVGNMLTTSYIDLRDETERTVIRSLVKGCRREHALEDGETVLISKPERFREYGVALIRDEQEGFAKEEVVTLEPETPEEAAKRCATADLNEAIQLVGSRVKSVHRVEYAKRNTQRESLSYGKDWWIFCASIRPDDGDWDAWKATLDEDYDHVSEIGQPAKFAQALARMVTEQIGPRARMRGLLARATGRRERERNTGTSGLSMGRSYTQIGCTRRSLVKRMRSDGWQRVCSRSPQRTRLSGSTGSWL